MLSILPLTEDTILRPTNSRILQGLWRLYSTMVRLMIIWALKTLQEYGSSMTDQSRNAGNMDAMGGSFPRSVIFYDIREKSQERHRSQIVQSAVQNLQEPLHVMVCAAITFSLELLLTELRSYCARQMQTQRKWFLTSRTTSKPLVYTYGIFHSGRKKLATNSICIYPSVTKPHEQAHLP
jgi:hypothetical protein